MTNTLLIPTVPLFHEYNASRCFIRKAYHSAAKMRKLSFTSRYDDDASLMKNFLPEFTRLIKHQRVVKRASSARIPFPRDPPPLPRAFLHLLLCHCVSGQPPPEVFRCCVHAAQLADSCTPPPAHGLLPRGNS